MQEDPQQLGDRVATDTRISYEELPQAFQEYVVALLLKERARLIERDIIAETTRGNRLESMVGVLATVSSMFEAAYGPKGAQLFAEGMSQATLLTNRQKSGATLLIEAIDAAVFLLDRRAAGLGPPTSSPYEPAEPVDQEEDSG